MGCRLLRRVAAFLLTASCGDNSSSKSKVDLSEDENYAAAPSCNGDSDSAEASDENDDR